MASAENRPTNETNGEAEKEKAANVEVTSAEAWGKPTIQGEKFMLPGSGNVARLKRIGLTGMVSLAGTIPNPLSARVLKFMAELGDVRRMTEEEQIENYKENAAAYADLARACFMSPIVVEEGVQPDLAKGQISANMIVDRDYTWLIYTFLMGDANQLATFRVE